MLLSDRTASIPGLVPSVVADGLFEFVIVGGRDDIRLLAALPHGLLVAFNTFPEGIDRRARSNAGDLLQVVSEKVPGRLKSGLAVLKHDHIGFVPQGPVEGDDGDVRDLSPESTHVGARGSRQNDSVDAGTAEHSQLVGLALRVFLVGEEDDGRALACGFKLDLLHAAAEVGIRDLGEDGANGVGAVPAKAAGDIVRFILQQLNCFVDASPNIVADVPSATQTAGYS